MKKNVGTMDRVLRTLFAIVVAALIVTGVLEGWPALLLGALGGILLITGIVRLCPIYMALKLSTYKTTGPR